MDSLNGVAPVAKSLENAHKLPSGARVTAVEDAQHARFGYYRYQLFDGKATISREEQQQQLTRAVLAALEAIERQPQ